MLGRPSITVERLPPSILNFFAGVSASASVSFLTAMTAQGSQPTWRLGVAAIPWATLAALFVWIAAVLESGRAEAIVISHEALSREERQANIGAVFDEFRPRLRILLAAAAAALTIGVVLMVVLFGAGAPDDQAGRLSTPPTGNSRVDRSSSGSSSPAGHPYRATTKDRCTRERASNRRSAADLGRCR